MDLSQYLETMKNLPERFSNLNFWHGVRKLRDKMVDTFEYVGEWGNGIEGQIDSLKGGISNKITKFYASSQGENDIEDSDNGKIMDMMIYGKSSQDGVPTQENPIEIKSVVSPKVKIAGKNLLNATLRNVTSNGVTCVNNGDGTYTLNGTALENVFIGVGNCLGSADKKYKLCGCPIGGNYTTYFSTLNNADMEYDIGNGATVSNLNFDTEYLIVVLKGTKVRNIIFKPMLTTDLNATYDDFEPYHEQTVTLPYTLSGIPVSSGGNVTINDQQYISDHVDAERGKLVKMVDSSKLDNTQSIANKTEWLLAEPQEIDLTREEVQTLKALATYYPNTNISINSEQLEGYAVFNYPISMQNGWNYVKQQLNDNRDYIYDMDTQSAEAYVNSEYAVALIEMEV